LIRLDRLQEEYYIYLKEHKKFKPNTIQKLFRKKEKLNIDLEFHIKEPEENKESVKLQCELSKQTKREDQVIASKVKKNQRSNLLH